MPAVTCLTVYSFEDVTKLKIPSDIKPLLTRALKENLRLLWWSSPDCTGLQGLCAAQFSTSHICKWATPNPSTATTYFVRL